MLQYFFEDTGNIKENEINRKLFAGLKIVEQGEEYLAHMGQYPVISLTLKSAKQPTFESAYFKLKEEITEEFKRHKGLLGQEGLDEDEKNCFGRLRPDRQILMYIQGR